MDDLFGTHRHLQATLTLITGVDLKVVQGFLGRSGQLAEHQRKTRVPVLVDYRLSDL